MQSRGKVTGKIETITLKVGSDDRDRFQSCAADRELSGEFLLRLMIKGYVEATEANQVPYRTERLRKPLPKNAVNYNVRLGSELKAVFCEACRRNGTTPSIVLREWISRLPNEKSEKTGPLVLSHVTALMVPTITEQSAAEPSKPDHYVPLTPEQVEYNKQKFAEILKTQFKK